MVNYQDKLSCVFAFEVSEGFTAFIFKVRQSKKILLDVGTLPSDKAKHKRRFRSSGEPPTEHQILQIFTHIPTYFLTPWSRVLLEKLTGFQPVKKFPAFYGTPRFITAFTSARHLSLSSSISIQSIPPTYYFLKIHLNIILPSNPGSPNCSISLRFPHQNHVYAFPLPHTHSYF